MKTTKNEDGTPEPRCLARLLDEIHNNGIITFRTRADADALARRLNTQERGDVIIFRTRPGTRTMTANSSIVSYLMMLRTDTGPDIGKFWSTFRGICPSSDEYENESEYLLGAAIMAAYEVAYTPPTTASHARNTMTKIQAAARRLAAALRAHDDYYTLPNVALWESEFIASVLPFGMTPQNAKFFRDLSPTIHTLVKRLERRIEEDLGNEKSATRPNRPDAAATRFRELVSIHLLRRFGVVQSRVIAEVAHELTLAACEIFFEFADSLSIEAARMQVARLSKPRT